MGVTDHALQARYLSQQLSPTEVTEAVSTGDIRAVFGFHPGYEPLAL
jgi:hypothetical protein